MYICHVYYGVCYCHASLFFILRLIYSFRGFDPDLNFLFIRNTFCFGETVIGSGYSFSVLLSFLCYLQIFEIFSNFNGVAFCAKRVDKPRNKFH